MRQFFLLFALSLVGCSGNGSEGSTDTGGGLLPAAHVPEITGFALSPSTATYMENDGAVVVTLEISFRDMGLDIRTLWVRLSDGRNVTFDESFATEAGTFSEELVLSTRELRAFAVEFWLVDHAGGSSDPVTAQFHVEATVGVPPILLSTCNFEIGGLGQGPDLIVDAGGQFELAVDFGDTLRGSVDQEPHWDPDVLFERFITDAGSTMDVTISRSQNALDGSFTISVTSDLFTLPAAFVFGSMPVAGTFEVVTSTETVTVHVVPGEFAPFGIEMSLNGGAAVPFTFQEYVDLKDDPLAETWQRRASLAGAVYAFVFDRVFQIAELLDELESTESATPIVTACDEFQGTPPADVLLQGEHVLTRLGSEENLAPGDVFDWRFTNCWFADSNSLIDNSMQMQNYIEDINANNTMTRIGFGPENNISGGVLFFDWTVAETEEIDGVYTIDPDERVEVNGGFSIVLTQP